jgi:4-hydroxybenzoate polyprenyltransferase
MIQRMAWLPPLRAALELIRPANVATSLADVLAGFAVGGLSAWSALPWLLLATACLYGGGITLNDVCDRATDARERPERPLPSGRVSLQTATLLATGLLVAGLGAAAMAGSRAALVATAIVVLVVLYDTWAKHHAVLGPITMGLCRGLNLLLGATVAPAFFTQAWVPALIVTAYIAAVTVVSRGEVTGGQKSAAALAFGLVSGVVAALGVLSLGAGDTISTVGAMVLTLFCGWRVVRAFSAAWRTPAAATIRNAVKTGVLSLALVDAVIAASYAGMIYCLALLATAFLAGRLARAFAVT